MLSEPGKEEITRAVAEAAYRRGARFVDVWSFDPLVKRARIRHAPEDTLGYVPPWWGQRMVELGEMGAARIALEGPAAPGALDDLDPRRAGRDRMPRLAEVGPVVNARSTNWTGVPAPTRAWAGLVHPELDPDAAYRKLWEEIVHVCRLDEPDPGGGVDAADGGAGRASASGSALSASMPLHFDGPGTDLTIGLLPTSRWLAAEFTRRDGLRHLVNLPSEEVFTTPGPGARRRCRPRDAAARVRRLDHPRHRGALRGRPRGVDRCRAGRRRPAHGHLARRRRIAPRGGRARRPRRPHRAARHGLLRHPAGRERREPHRARLRVHVRDRRCRLAAREQEPRSTSTS